MLELLDRADPHIECRRGSAWQWSSARISSNNRTGADDEPSRPAMMAAASRSATLMSFTSSSRSGRELGSAIGLVAP